MSTVLTGGCLCGAVRYRYAGDIGPAGYCHCTDCRRRTGSAFGLSVRVDANAFQIIAGQAKGFTKRADSGNELTLFFCPDCGAPLYTSSPRHPEYLFVTAGSIDDPSLLQPAHQSWVQSRVPWAVIAPSLPGFSKNPANPLARSFSDRSYGKRG